MTEQTFHGFPEGTEVSMITMHRYPIELLGSGGVTATYDYDDDAIVEDAIKGKVLSPVYTEWIEVTTEHDRLVCTPNQLIRANDRWRTAASLYPGDITLRPTELWTYAAVNVARAMLLGGNARITHEGSLSDTHNFPQAAYETQRMLPAPTETYSNRYGGAYRTSLIAGSTWVNESLIPVYEEFHETCRFDAPLDLSFMDRHTIAKMFMDCGHVLYRSAKHDTTAPLVLTLSHLSREGVARVGDQIQAMYGLSYRIRRNVHSGGRGQKGFDLIINQGRDGKSFNMWADISERTIPERRLKLPKRWFDMPHIPEEPTISVRRAEPTAILTVRPFRTAERAISLNTMSGSYFADGFWVHQ